MIGPDVDADALSRRIDEYRILGAGDGHLTVRAIKRYMDGALGTHGAWLLAPYADRTDRVGMNVTPLPELERAAEIAIGHGFQLCVHAIGDRANRETLDLYERTFARHPDRRDLRWRIEHVQHLDPQDIPRFASLGVIASMQGIHCTSDGPWVEERLGAERAERGAYVWRRLLDSGALVVNGTDAPVEALDPLANFHASVTRQMSNGRAFYPAQRMTRLEALRSQTLDAARAAFEEGEKGSLAVGKRADVTVLSEDILTVPVERILKARVLYTIVGGRIVHEDAPR
jgi:predicted amidohydrolase YtcJ